MTASEQAPRTPSPRRRRRRWPWILLVTLVVLAGGAAVAAEVVARAVVPERVRETARAQLGLPEDHPLDVEVGGLMLPQLLEGSLDDVRIAGSDLPLPGEAGLVVDARVHLTSVPVRAGVAGGAGTAELRLGADDLQGLIDGAALPAGLDDPQVALAEPHAVLTASVAILGATIPIEMTLAPGAADGRLTLEPAGARIGGAELSIEQVGAMLGVEPGPVPICLADRLPAGLTLTGVAIEGDTLAVELDVAEGTLTDPALTEPGTCR